MSLASMRKALSMITRPRREKLRAAKFFRDNLFLDRLIEVGTKALRRELMSGETLRAPRQQLRRLHASAFDLSAKSPTIARLFGACCILEPTSCALSGPAIRSLLTPFPIIRKSVRLIRKNLTALCRHEDRGYSCADFLYAGRTLIA
jgi:hypothetical protein